MKYRLRPEDSIASVCKKFDITPDGLAALNNCVDSTQLYIDKWGTFGAEIEVPDMPKEWPQCKYQQDPVVKRHSETLAIGVDFAGEDISVLTIGRLDGLKVSTLNVFYGKKAENIYNQLLGRSKNDNN